jgi:hypothetical protein
MLRNVFLMLIVCLGCLFTPDAAFAQEAPSQPQVKARWGILADLAGRDFSGNCPGCSELMLFFRWTKPGEELLWLNTGSWGQGTKVTITQSAEGRLTYVADSGPTAGQTFDLTSSENAIVLPRYGKMQVRMRLVDQGVSYEYRRAASAEWIKSAVYIDVASASAKVQEIAAKRRAKAGLTSPGKPTYATAALPQPPTASKPASPVAVAEPSTNAVRLPSSGPRLALVIGNSKYGASLGDLANPANDAATMTRALGTVGFQVEMLVDADQKAIKRAIARFGEQLRAAGPGSTGLFFYAGHGIQSRGTNYLIPIGAAIEAEADVDLESVAADTVLLQMEEAGSSTNIVILDACRNMPVSRSFRSGTRGLARMEAPNGSFVAYSTAPGSVAADGDGKNSPFVTALAQQISRKGQPIEVIFRDVRRTVLESTGGKQTPWDSSSLISPFYFVGE